MRSLESAQQFSQHYCVTRMTHTLSDFFTSSLSGFLSVALSKFLLNQAFRVTYWVRALVSWPLLFCLSTTTTKFRSINLCLNKMKLLKELPFIMIHCYLLMKRISFLTYFYYDPLLFTYEENSIFDCMELSIFLINIFWGYFLL